MQRRDWRGVCGVTLLKEETLCSRGLRLLAVAAAVSWAVRACSCTTRPASRACSRDGWGFCCCNCRLCTSCCNCKWYQRPHLLHPPPYSHALDSLAGLKWWVTIIFVLTCCPWGLCRICATAATVSVLLIWDAQSGRPWTILAGVAGVAGVPAQTHSGVMLKSPEVASTSFPSSVWTDQV